MTIMLGVLFQTFLRSSHAPSHAIHTPHMVKLARCRGFIIEFVSMYNVVTTAEVTDILPELKYCI